MQKAMNHSQFALLLITGTALCPIQALAQPTNMTSAPAQQPSQASQTFQPITITATDESWLTPWATQTDRARLDALQIQNWSQLGARSEPGINFNSANNSINIRGLDKNRVVTKIDGIRQSYLTDVRGVNGGVRGGVSAIDFNSLASIDIVRGADSSIVGSGAFGGAVDVRTLSPSDLLSNGRTFGMIAKTGYYSADHSWLLNSAVAGQIENGLQWMLQAGVQLGKETINQGTQGGYGLTRTEPNPDQYTQQNYQLKLQKNFGDGHTLGLTGAYFSRNDQVTDLMASPVLFQPEKSRVADDTLRQSLALNYKWKAGADASLVDTLDTQLYWQNVSLSSDLNAIRTATPVGRYQRGNTMQENSYGINFQVAKKIKGVVSQQWELGGEWDSAGLKQYASGKDNCPTVFSRRSPCAFFHVNQTDVPKTTGDKYGLWVQNTVAFSDGEFSLTPGVRYDYYKYTPASADAFQGNPTATAFAASSAEAWSPKLLATWLPAEHLSLYAQYALSFNAPTATQLYSRFGSVGTYLISGNPALKPEHGRGWELGAKYDHEQLSGSLTYFDNRYTNFIDAINLPGNRQYPFFIQTYENLEDVRIYGVEARGEWRFTKGWQLFGSLAWTVGSDLNSGRSLNSVAPLQAIAGLAYSEAQWGAGARVSAAAARTKVTHPAPTPTQPFSDFKAPGYGIVDLTAYWRPAELKGVNVQIGLFNALNKTYWNALDVPTATDALQSVRLANGAYSQPGRNVSLSVTYQY